MDNVTELQGDTWSSNNSLFMHSPGVHDLCVRCIHIWSFVVSLPFLFGILFNLIIICVLCKNTLVKPNARFLLQMIAIADMVYLIMASIPAFIQIMMVSLGEKRKLEFNEFLTSLLTFDTLVALPVMNTASTTSLWLVMFLAVDLVLRSYRPATAEKYLSRAGFCGITSALWFGSAVISVTPIIIASPYGMIVSANALVPIVVLVFTICCLIRILQSGRHGDQATDDIIDNNERDWQKAVTVVAIMTIISEIVSDVCEVYVVVHIYEVYDINLANLSDVAIVNAVSWLSIALNSSIKFVIYVTVVGASFRHRLGLCCCCCCLRRPAVTSAPAVQLTDVTASAADKLLSDTDGE